MSAPTSSGTSTPPPPVRLPLPTAISLTFRPRYNECDPMGIVHHAAYIPWLEIGRTELLRAAGLSYAQLEAQGVLLAIIDLQVKYKASARYDDVLQLHTRVTGGSRVKLVHEYTLTLLHPATGPALDEPRTLLTASTTLACIDRAGRPQALPDWLTMPSSRPTA